MNLNKNYNYNLYKTKINYVRKVYNEFWIRQIIIYNDQVNNNILPLNIEQDSLIKFD